MVVIPADIILDLDELIKVAEASFAKTPDASLKEWFSFEEMKKQIELGRGICIKAVSESGDIIGLTYAQQENPINGPEGEEKWVIVLAGVDPSASGKGVGSALLGGIEKAAKNGNATKMFVFTNKDDLDVISFYKKNGYEDAGWVRDYQYGKDNSAVFLLKYL